MADYAYWQTVGTWAGAVLLFATLFLMIRANKAAVRAAEAGEQNAKHQRVANRPLLTPTNYRLERELDGSGEGYVVPPTFAFRMDILNIGGSPAFFQKYGITHFIGTGEPGLSADLIERELVGRWFIRSDAHRDFKAPFHHIRTESDGALAQIESCRHDLLVYGYLQYADSFGAVWRSGFCFEYIPSADTGANMAICGPAHLWHDRETSAAAHR